MSDPDDLDELEPAPKPRRSGRLRRFALWVFGAFAVVVLVLLVGRLQVGRIGQRQLNATTNRLDAEDPGWRLDAIHAQRRANAPPPEQDAAPMVMALGAQIPREWSDWQLGNEANPWPGAHPDNRLPPDAVVRKLRKHAEASKPVRDEALKLRDKRAGYYPLEIGDDPMSTLLPHLDKARTVAALLLYDGYLAALDKDPNRAIAAARAALAVGRSIGDEPVLISQLVRFACNKIAAQIAMQALAWGQPTEGLAELQAELLAEAEVPWLRIGIRGERAMLDKMFVGLENGTISAGAALAYFQISKPGPQHFAAFRAYRAFLPGDHAKCLQLLTEYHQAAKLPHHEQLAAIKKIPNPKADPGHYKHIITCLMLPACNKVAEASLRCRADLLAAATCLACERFRQQHKRWPNDLAELVPAFLPAVPHNPFDGQPLAYRQLPDRVVVYCYWADAPQARVRIDDPPEFREPHAKGAGVGYRVWNPDQRALPPEEKPVP